MRVHLLKLLGGSLLAFAAADAATLDYITVKRDGPAITAQAEFIVDVPHDAVVQAFSSFEELSRLNPAVLFSKAEATDDGRMRVTTRLRDCVMLFCRSITLVENVSVFANGDMIADIEHGSGDFSDGRTAWTFEADGARTRVSYRSTMQPDFWMPPLVGQRAMRKALRRQITASVENLERQHAAKHEPTGASAR